MDETERDQIFRHGGLNMTSVFIVANIATSITHNHRRQNNDKTSKAFSDISLTDRRKIPLQITCFHRSSDNASSATIRSL